MLCTAVIRARRAAAKSCSSWRLGALVLVIFGGLEASASQGREGGGTGLAHTGVSRGGQLHEALEGTAVSRYQVRPFRRYNRPARAQLVWAKVSCVFPKLLKEIKHCNTLVFTMATPATAVNNNNNPSSVNSVNNGAKVKTVKPGTVPRVVLSARSFEDTYDVLKEIGAGAFGKVSE